VRIVCRCADERKAMQRRFTPHERPARLDLTFYPYLPAATVGATDPRAYLGLIASSGPLPATAGVSA
jgi:hypothetical protein